MAQSWFFAAVILSLASLATASLHCEDLLVEDCAFAISSSGARCVLEKMYYPDGATRLQCQTSLIVADKPEEWIETDECLESCGLSRMTFGLSTDILLDVDALDKLCSTSCMHSCSNILDLYIKLAAGEGIYLPQLCEANRHEARRSLSEDAWAPAPAPDSSADM
eukprot:TRINITY_DN10915_c0_g1_i1.p1 TRINITY_DN10915_c0_g1~~TRINITY_DN10915_c0_g1_i1.p1  ORF type:complete len:189 (-),score=16.29 TRINITY_DN10915_c0_g1_i1:323-817(-)